MLDNHLLEGCGEVVYGLRTSDWSVLLPTHAPHTRYRFAHLCQTKIIIELAKRLKNGFVVNGIFATRSISKINQCVRIMDYYHDKYLP